MNKRIIELVDQAGFARSQWWMNNNHESQFDRFTPTDDAEFTQRLLEYTHSIVRECCEVAHCNFHVDGLTLGTILREHFGVEE
jgi:hypothetical protein